MLKFGSPIEELFAENPFIPFYKHSELLNESILILKQVFYLFEKKKFREMEKKCKSIVELESKADYLKNQIRERLPKKLLLPIDKNDLLVILNETEIIIDDIENCALLLSIEKKNLIPDRIIKEMNKIIEKDVEIVTTLHQLIDELKNLLETTFSKKEISKAKDLITKVANIEEEVDKLGFSYLKTLFETKKLSALMVFYITSITRKLTEISNHAEVAAETVRLIITKRER